MNETIIPIDSFESIELSKKSVKDVDGARKFSPLGDLESHNLILYLKDEITMNGMYGIRSVRCKVVALHVDEVERLSTYLVKR